MSKKIVNHLDEKYNEVLSENGGRYNLLNPYHMGYCDGLDTAIQVVENNSDNTLNEVLSVLAKASMEELHGLHEKTLDQNVKTIIERIVL
jgi:iron-sulfur cluster repair protein YtfE (RIC family)